MQLSGHSADAQNPKLSQHSSTLECLPHQKPIQRILKYPLLLRSFALTDAESEEHYHLDGEPRAPENCLVDISLPEPLNGLFIYFMTCFPPVAIKTMNKVASHINEMQKIHEEFGAVFDQLFAEQTGEKKR